MVGHDKMVVLEVQFHILQGFSFTYRRGSHITGVHISLGFTYIRGSQSLIFI